MRDMKTEFAPFRVTFDPDRYSQKTLAMVLSKAEEWNCSPLEAEARLLDELAEKSSTEGGAA